MKAMESLRSLPISERLQLVEDLWDSIAVDAGGLPLTEAQREELDRRLDDFELNPTAGVSWDQFRSTLQQQP